MRWRLLGPAMKSGDDRTMCSAEDLRWRSIRCCRIRPLPRCRRRIQSSGIKSRGRSSLSIHSMLVGNAPSFSRNSFTAFHATS